MFSSESNQLKNWFIANARILPWRENRTPYSVWVSEMMLQQTQVFVVIPYFERWMCRFPNVESLAKANLDEVIKLWEGLGYYSRARYLHSGAKFIVEFFGGEFPKEEENLKKIKGIGPYTIGAIQSFAFHQRAAAVDGNVLRVLSRFFHIAEDIGKATTVQYMRQIALDILPEKDPWIISEALIELGATICGRQPQCTKCPIKQNCRAYLKGIADQLPYKAKKIKIEKLQRVVMLINWKEKWLVRRAPKKEIMSDLHEFPYFESEMGSTKSWEARIKTKFGFNVDFQQILDNETHSFTRYRVTLLPIKFVCTATKEPIVDEAYQWCTKEEMNLLAFSSGHRRILRKHDFSIF